MRRFVVQEQTDIWTKRRMTCIFCTSNNKDTYINGHHAQAIREMFGAESVIVMQPTDVKRTVAARRLANAKNLTGAALRQHLIEQEK